VKILEISLLALHIYIDLSLGTSVANISLKKLQTTGPYGVVRHPGTTTKLAFWILISACYSAFWSWPIILGQLAWSALYIGRAITEERHLRQHEEYREYMKKVRYRFIPGLL
jgi:protein-S-isoprenylcysteine O-methyltransferase Ste14